MIVLLDPGHGVDTAGKRSPNGMFREYYFNRQVCDLIQGYLRWKGIDSRIIVTETNDIPLSTRARRVNMICEEEGVQNCILLSIHANACGNGSAWMNGRGWSCYTTKGKTKSDTIADCLYDAFEEDFPDRKIRKDMTDGDRDWEENFTIIYKAKCPAVLLENFFYDNKEECMFLMMAETRERIAKAVVKGIEKYIALCETK